MKISPLRESRQLKYGTLQKTCYALSLNGVNISESTLSKIELGKFWPKKKLAENLSHFLDIPVEQILFPEKFGEKR